MHNVQKIDLADLVPNPDFHFDFAHQQPGQCPGHQHSVGSLCYNTNEQRGARQRVPRRLHAMALRCSAPRNLGQNLIFLTF